ncbi:hypothetical protein HanXRQr2_Chr17g0816461 [Helianthus annuus]|uniref:Uncharacterized protein n=1 Tax=Helianthus annuus TaxID=4232 RepID=A0A9K3DM52_HELAN|nr:hypothetical protein HanXRQr2_Chr17g0816461 [Helianthus annuus]KAJ0814320.1 hypothetical protein HanPSC8_Chr17g0784231 [Helianthus annuus]
MQNDAHIHDVSHFTFFKYPRRLTIYFFNTPKARSISFLADSCFFLKYNIFSSFGHERVFTNVAHSR